MPAGRPAGAPNKIGAAVKSNVIAVFDKIGGRDGMAKWAEDNRTEFYRLYARLIPSEVTATVDLRDASQLSDEELLVIAAASSLGAARQANGEALPSEVH